MTTTRKSATGQNLVVTKLNSTHNEMIYDIREKVHELLLSMNTCIEQSSVEEVVHVTNGHLSQFEAKFRLRLLDGPGKQDSA